MKDIHREFVPYEEALALRDLGFDDTCFGRHGTTSKKIFTNRLFKNSEELLEDGVTFTNDLFAAPLYQQAFRWFREEYGLVYMPSIGNNDYTYKIFDENKGRSGEMIEKDAYFRFNGAVEEAELACLRKLIEIVK